MFLYMITKREQFAYIYVTPEKKKEKKKIEMKLDTVLLDSSVVKFKVKIRK